MNDIKNEIQDEFLKDLDIKDTKTVLDTSLIDETNSEKEEDSEEMEQKARNRKERKMGEKIQQLREEAIALNARLETIKESQSLRNDSEEAEYLKRVEKIYGNASPEAVEATTLLKESLEAVKKAAKEEALQEIYNERGNEAQAIRTEEQNIDSILEKVEEDYDIDITSKTERDAFLYLLGKLSPKDKDGNIIEYADPDATAEIFLSHKEKKVNRAKELANRSTTRSGAISTTTLQDDSTVRFLKANGII